MSTKTAVATTAAKLLGLRFNDAVRNSRGLPAEEATHFWNPGQGGGSVIVANDGTYLFANSTEEWACHLGDFIAGQRSISADQALGH